MTTYGSPAQPDDPYQRPTGTPGGPPPIDPTLPEWGQPPAAREWGQQQPGSDPQWGQPQSGSDPQWGQQQPGSGPQWGQPPSGGEPPANPQWGQPDPAWHQPAQPPAPEPGYPPPPTSGAGYPPPTSGAGYPPSTSGAGYPPPPGAQPPAGQGGYPAAGPYPPAGPAPAPGNQWGAPPPVPGGYGMPLGAPPAKKSGGKIALVIGLVVVLLLCPCLGLAGWAFWQGGDDEDPIAAPTVSASADPTGQPTTEPTDDPTTEPTDEPSAAPTSARPSPSRRDFAKGDCVVNDGTASKAELRKVPCGPNTYEVLLRIPGTADGDRCKTRAPEATANYVHDNSVDFLDYVLCLKKR